MLRINSRERLVSRDEFDTIADSSPSSSLLSSRAENDSKHATTPPESPVDTSTSSPKNKKENDAHHKKRFVGKKRDHHSSCTSTSSSTLLGEQLPSDMNNKKAIKKSISFSELTKLSSSRIMPQPMPNTSNIAVMAPRSAKPIPSTSVKTAKTANEVPMAEPSVLAKNDYAEANNPSMYACAHNMNDADNDDECRFTLSLDAKEQMDDFARPYETLSTRSSATGNGSTPAFTFFKTTAKPCCEEKPCFKKSFSTQGKSIESTRNNTAAAKDGAIGSPPDIGFTDLMDDAILHALSYLISADIRNVSVTSSEVRSLITASGAAQHFWMNICQRESWGSSISVISKCASGEENRLINFRDNLSIPVAGITQNDTVANKNVNLSVLLGLTANSFPAAIDPAFFQNNIGMGTRYNLLRRPIFRTFPLTCDLARLKTRRHDYDGEEVGKVGTDTLNVVQFTSRVGGGKRCIKSDHPFPRLAKNKSDNSGSRLRRCTKMPEQLPDHGSSLTFGNNSAIPPTPAADQGTSPATSSMRPFVIPRLLSEVGDTVEVDVTPCLVAYFEVTILPRDESQEPPLPSAPPLLSNTLSSRTAAAAAAARARVAFLRSRRGTNQRRTAVRVFADAMAALEEDRRAQSHNDDAAGGIPPPVSSVKECVAVGLSTASFAVHRKLPGWDAHSYGYHGDDGKFFHRGSLGRKFGSTFGMNDTVGCGIDYETRSIFFTRNGEFLGYVSADLEDSILQEGLYPTVGVDTNCPLFVNFGGKPFECDLSSICRWSGDLLEEKLSGLLRPCGVKVGSCVEK